MTVPGSLYLIASRILDCVTDTYTEQGIPLPSRRLVYGGQQIPADPDPPDSEPGLLAVGLVSVQQGLPGITLAGGMQPPALIFSATFQVEVHRPSSGLTQQTVFPADVDLEVDALTFLNDGQTLLDAFIRGRTTGQIVGEQPIMLDGIVPLPIQGNDGATRMQLTCGTEGPLV